MKKLFTTLMIIFSIGSANAWTDTDLCIDSYDGIISYELAVAGCTAKHLPGLSTEQQMEFWNDYSAQQQNEVIVVVKCQAMTGYSIKKCAEINKNRV